MAESSWGLQAAVHTALDAALSCEVYDDVPQGAAFPYVTIGDDTAVDWSGSLMRGEESTLTVHAWSRYAGRKEAKDLLASIKAALHEQSLSVTGANLVNLRFEFSETFMDADGETRHGVIRFRAVTIDA